MKVSSLPRTRADLRTPGGQGPAELVLEDLEVRQSDATDDDRQAGQRSSALGNVDEFFSGTALLFFSIWPATGQVAWLNSISGAPRLKLVRPTSAAALWGSSTSCSNRSARVAN